MNTTGIYIHIPFCISRCSYCDFATDVYRDNDTVERYMRALAKEIEDFDDSFAKHAKAEAIESDTVYFGGGTPSLLSAVQLERVLKAVHGRFDVRKNAEVTMEMNPGTVSASKLGEFRRLGVNRASFGVQTFDDRALRLLARGHDAEDARKTYGLLRSAGFDNVSLDLIGGLPHQTLEDWENNLREAIELSPEHISLYLLEIHEGTPLAEQISSGRRPLPDELLAARMYELMLDQLGENGFRQYEISNFCRPGRESQHNLKYWEFDPVLGFGVSAHSFDGKSRRWANVRDTGKYTHLIETARSPCSEMNELSRRELAGEFAFLKLRLNKGISLNEYQARFGSRLEQTYKDELQRAEELGLVEILEGRLKLKGRGRILSNEVFSIFV